MNNKNFLSLFFYLFSFSTTQTMDFQDNRECCLIVQKLSPTLKKLAVNYETQQEPLQLKQRHTELQSQEQEMSIAAITVKEIIDEKNQPNLPNDSQAEQEKYLHNIQLLKKTTIFGTLTGAAITALCAIKQHQNKKQQIPTRFIATAATTGASLAWTLCQTVGGCAILGIGYYKIRSWIYDGYVKSAQFNDLEKKVINHDYVLKKVQEQQRLHSIAINDHAIIFDKIHRTLKQSQQNIDELEQVVTKHAKELNAGRTIAQKLAEAIDEHAIAITHNAQIQEKSIAQKNNNSEKPTIVSQKPIQMPKGIEGQAAVPKFDNPEKTDTKVSAITVPLEPRSPSFWSGFPCCDEDSIKTK